ncbi:hypothetical protein [Alkalihalobacterium alkalinitrilicum]|uniref:hypothetical protein n=1 Tax=Alkalihalobacterium alkalinitrilicum TaxID=427920 RepID=UPI0009957CC3|nr:hypothetical protein [Alkalihalobacterium alkalinitrilicum]
MKAVKLSNYFNIVKPDYVYLKIVPNKSIRNNSSHKIAKSIASLQKNITERIQKDDAKIMRILGKEFLVGTKFSYRRNAKVSYFIYIEKKSIQFFLIVPKQYLSIIKERISDVWTNITIEEVGEVPKFSDNLTMYQLVYEKEDALSLATNRSDNDLLTSNLNVVDVMEEGDRVGIFYNFMPMSQGQWRPLYRNTMAKVKELKPVERNKLGLSYVIKSIIAIASDIVDNIGETIGGENKSKRQDENVNVLASVLERMNGGKQITESTHKKATSIILNTQIVVLSESKKDKSGSDVNKKRQHNNAKSLATSFDTIAGDNRLTPKSLKKTFNYTDYSIKSEINKIGDQEAQSFLSLPGRELLERYNFIEKIHTQETQVPEDLRKGLMRIGESIYRGMKQPAYLSTDREYQYLSLILIGPNRSGKSTLIGNQSYDAIANGECVIMFDYIGNCELSEEVSALFPHEKILNINCDDPKTIEGLGYNEIRYSADPKERYINAKKQTTQLLTLVNSINSDDTDLTARMRRFMESAALAVFVCNGSIKDVFSVLQNAKERAKYIKQIPQSLYEDMEEYIGYLHELDEIDKGGNVTGTKAAKIEGILSRLNALKANPYMEWMLKKSTEGNIDLVEEMQKNQLICIKMPETMFGTDNEKDMYTTYWITKLWLALQIRKAKYKDNREKMTKVNLFIDELYQVENTEKFLTDKLSRLPKFNIKPIISCHYLNQIKHIREELRSANASYMLISGCDKKNFKELESELYPFTEEDLLNLKRYHSMNLIKCKDGYGRFITKLPGPVSEQEKNPHTNEVHG